MSVRDRSDAQVMKCVRDKRDDYGYTRGTVHVSIHHTVLRCFCALFHFKPPFHVDCVRRARTEIQLLCRLYIPEC